MGKLSSRHDDETLIRASVDLAVEMLEHPERVTVEWWDRTISECYESTRYLVTVVQGGSHGKAH